MKKASLNHRYRLIWSRIKHAWVAVAEHIKSDGKKATCVRDNNQTVSSFSSSVALALTKKTQLTLVVLTALFSASQNVYAQWTDLVIQSGQASTQQVGNNLTINVATSRVTGTASSLDIAANENVNVFFEIGGGTGLFRSTGNSATNIYGGLSSNGNLFLINQNGVLFGQSAQVDVGGLVASSMNISNADFQNGNYQFNVNGNTSGVTNQGVIKVSDGGYLILLGKEVNNSGTLVANQGSVVMASADSAVLDFYGNGLVKANLSGDALEAVVEQSGVVQADGGAVQLATNSRSSAVNVSGLVQANSLVERNGVIRLEGGNNAQVAVGGTLSAKGNQAETTGGNIAVTGEQVALLNSAQLDASGQTGGGSVLVGGDFQGKNTQVQNARTTYVGQNATIAVDATEQGDGGKVIVWANQTTRYYGNISAQGGKASGNGGFAEVSGKQFLDFIGGVDVSAAKGLGGYVLLDPENIVLNNSAQIAPPDNADGTPDVAFADAPAIGTTTIQIADVTGFSELFLQATNDITVANNITMVTNNSIRLEANNNLTVNGQIRTQGHGDINLKADADSNGVGDLALNRRVFSRQGDITLSGANVVGTTSGTILTQGLVGQDSGNVSINASHSINLAGTIVTNGRNGSGLIDGGNAGDINITAAGAITTGNVSASGGHGGTGAGSNANGGAAGMINITSTAAGNITTAHIAARTGAARGTGAGGNAGSINVTNTSGNINTRNLDTYGNANGDGGDITVAAASGHVTVTGRVYTYGGGIVSGHTLAGRNGGAVNITGDNRTITSRINANGNTARGTNQDGGNAGTVSITGSGTLNTKDIYSRTGAATGTGAGGTEGSITLSGSAITSTGTIYTAGNRNGDGGDISLISTAGDITATTVYAHGGSANTGTTGNDAGNITINAAGAVTTSHVYVQGSSGNGADNNGGNAGAITVNAAGAITAERVYAYGGNGGGNNALSNTAAGGNAGAINIASTGAGDITLNQDVNVRTGYSRGSAVGASAGSINIKNDNGNITTKNIRADGQNHGKGGDVVLDAGTTGDVTVNGVIYTYGDVNPTAASFVGTDAGDLTIKSANTTVTNTINANGGRGRGVNQVGGDAGNITIDATGAISTQTIAANGGNAGSGAGSNAAGGDAGDINITSTGAGDITTTNITARTGYTRGGATATGAGSVNIQNDNGALTTGNITTRGQRRGVGGDVIAVTTGGDISVGTVDARASNLAATDGGDVTLATTTGDATVTNILTGGRWLVYSGDPRNDTIGVFKSTADFKQYNTNYGDTLLDAGNGFVYRFAPTITTSLTGAVSKAYDGNTTASIAGLTLNQTGGEIDGDVINISALTSATYDTKNVGSGKTVISNALTVTSGSNGGTTVYGYQVSAATGNVGIITESALSLAEDAAASNPRNTAGLGGVLGATQEPQQFVAVFDVGATAAGGDLDAEACVSNEDKKLQNPNTSLMLNFGVNLPEGVKKTCI